MYRILIVDDEKIERNGIKMLLKQCGIDCETEEAVNGKAAYEMIEKGNYDILLTDVKMPFMDGIELISKVADLNKDIKCVIFSGCSEFDYAKRAVRLGVSDYILKPVDPTEFATTLNKVTLEIEENRVEDDLKSKSIEYMYEHMLYMAVNGSTMQEIEEYNENLLDISFLNCFKRMMLIEFNSEFFGGCGVGFKEYILSKEPKISKYLNLNQQQSVLFFEDTSVSYVENAERICENIKKDYGTNAYIAISEELEGFEGIAKGMEELDYLMENKFYHTSRNVFYKGMNNESMSVIQIDDDTLMKQMKQDIKMKDADGLREHFKRFCDKYSNKTEFSQVYVKFLFSNLLKDFHTVLPGTDEQELDEEIEGLYKANDLNVVIDIVNKNIDRLEKVFSDNSLAVHKEIEVIKRYIYDHYGEELSVDLFSEMVYMAPSYLSSVFKKETGQNLSRFIKAYRMERAKDMLENSMAKIVDISIACGYPNVSYFCSSFREYYGVSPQKFREVGEQQ